MLVPLNLQKPVNGLSLLAGKLGHSFCRSSRGCRKAYVQPLALEETKYALERGGFTCSGRAGDNRQVMAKRHIHRCLYGKLLLFGIRYIIGFFDFLYLAVKCRMACRRKIQKHLYAVAYALFIAKRLN